MRILRINGRLFDLDDKTSLGITFQAYDIKEPGSRKAKYSNTFTAPCTANNLEIIGNPQSPHSLSLAVYDTLTCDYWDNSLPIIQQGKCRIEEVGERISLFIYEKKDVWEAIKEVKFRDFLNDFFLWLTVPKYSTPFTGSFADFLQPYTVATEGIYLPYLFSNFYGKEATEGVGDYIEKPSQLFLHYGGWNGGNFCVYYKTIFQYIEHKYGVNFLTAGGVVAGNVWDDQYAKACYRPIRTLDVGIRFNNTGDIDGYYFNAPSVTNFEPHGEINESEDKTLYDVVNCFLQHFNIVTDDIRVGNSDAIRMARWDDMDKAEVIDWSGKLTGTPRFKPSINGYAQNNHIKYGEVYDGGAETAGELIITSKNKNLDATAELFTIDAYYPGVINTNGTPILDMTTEATFNNNMVLIDSGLTQQANVYYNDTYKTVGAALTMRIAATYGISNEYRLLNTIVKYPKWYEITKWLNINDVLDIQFFRLYYIKELGASFFINKIANFNPSKGLQPVKIELIKVSEKTPIYPPDLEYWMDGINDAWTDGVTDYYY